MRRIRAFLTVALSAALIFALGGSCGTSEEDASDTDELFSFEPPSDADEPPSFEVNPPNTDEPFNFEWNPPNTDELPSDADELPPRSNRWPKMLPPE